MKKLNTVISSRINRSVVLAEIYRNPMISRVQLAARTELDRSAITQILNYLLGENLVLEVAKGKPGTRGGRRPIHLDIRHEARTVAAVEVGMHSVKAILADLSGKELARVTRPVKRGESLIDLLIITIDELATLAGAPFQKCAVIGIAAPGVLNPETGTMISNMFHNWRDVPVAEQLSKKYGCHVFVENDANVGALGEIRRLPAERTVDSLVYLFIRDSEGKAPLGVGGALIMEGKVWHGAHQFAGESSSTINATFHQILMESGQVAESEKGGSSQKNLISLLERAKHGDKGAIKARETMADRIGHLLCDICLFVDPAAVMVSLSPHENTGDFRDSVQKAFERYLTPNDRHITFLNPVAKEDAPLDGLIARGIDKLFVRDSSTISILFEDI